jgi:hypothetical protein
MTLWEVMVIVLSAAALFTLILGAFVAYSIRKNREANRELIRSIEGRITNARTSGTGK